MNVQCGVIFFLKACPLFVGSNDDDSSALSKTHSEGSASDSAPKAVSDSASASSDEPEELDLTEPQHLVVAWFEGSIAPLIKSLQHFAPRRSTVTVVAKTQPEVSV